MSVEEHNERDAVILPFPVPGEQLAEMPDEEVLDHFLSELRHPGVRNRLAQYILEYAGSRPRDGLNAERIAWRERMGQIRFSVGVSNNDWDKLVDESNEEYDAGFAAIVQALQTTRDNKDLAEERQALLVLLDLRVAAINRGLFESEEWEALVDNLTRKA